MSKEFGERVKKARLAEGLSQQALAEKVGSAQGTVSTWELGASEPRAAQLAKLEAVLGKVSASTNQALSQEGEGPNGAFGAWLKKERARAELSVQELANASTVSTVAIYNIESGVSLNPRIETKQKLEQALKATIPEEVNAEAETEQGVAGLGSLKDFDPHSEGDRPSSAGVYVLYDISDRPIYVGKSQNIARRIRDHDEKFWFKRPIITHASYIEIAEKTLRDQIEQILIKFLKSNAVINKQFVDRD
jgi:transcriptional regulator with XRE-family HTH domain